MHSINLGHIVPVTQFCILFSVARNFYIIDDFVGFVLGILIDLESRPPI